MISLVSFVSMGAIMEMADDDSTILFGPDPNTQVSVLPASCRHAIVPRPRLPCRLNLKLQPLAAPPNHDISIPTPHHLLVVYPVAEA